MSANPRREPKPAEDRGPAEATPPSPPASDSVDQIRDILFGRQMAEYEQRFGALEERLIHESRELRETMQQQMDQLGKELDRRVSDALQRLAEEREARERSHADLMTQLATRAENLLGELAQTREALEQRLAALQDELQVAHRKLLDDLERQGREAERQLRDTAARLGHEKVDQNELAGLFGELAQRLQQADS